MRTFGLVGLLVALAAGYFVYSEQMQSVSKVGGSATPGTTIDMVGVRTDLTGFANAERQQFALEGRYLPLDDLRAKGMPLPADRRGPYTYTAEVSDTDFRIVATYTGGSATDAPATLSIGPSMQIE